MGEIIIKVPGDVKEEFEIKSESILRELLELLQKEDRREVIQSVTGLWSDRYEGENSAGIGKKIRKEFWRK